MRPVAQLLAFALALIVVSACGGAGDVGRPEDVKEFEALYQRNCAGCHGPNGRMGVAQPLNDPTYLAIVPDARLHDVVAHGVPGTPMPAFARAAGGDLTDQQIQIVVEGVRRAWGRTSSDTTPRYRTDDVTPDAVRGGDVFRTACAKCHGEDGAGGEGAGSVVDRAFLSLTSDQALRTAIIAGRPDLGTPGWKDYVAGAPMTEQQISDVVAWLTSHRGQHE